MKKIFFIITIISLLIIGAFVGSQTHQNVVIHDLSNRNYFFRTIESIEKAENSIHIVMFEMRYYPNNTNSSENALIKELIRARERNVSVKVVLEGGEDYLGSDFITKQKLACSILRNASIAVRFDPKEVTTHAKLLIIDNKIVIIGSTNWVDYALEKNNEANIMIVSKSVAQTFENYFQKLWLSSEDAVCVTQNKPDEKCLGIGKILQNKDYCNGRLVSAQGIVRGLNTRASKSGNIYTTFDLIADKDSIKIFIWGEPDFENEDNVTVVGIYRKEKKVGKYSFFDEIEAGKIKATNVDPDSLN